MAGCIISQQGVVISSKVHRPPRLCCSSPTPHFLSLITLPPRNLNSSVFASNRDPIPSIAFSNPALRSRHFRVPECGAQVWDAGEEGKKDVFPELEEDLAVDGDVYQKTLRLVECSMFAAVAGLAYFLSNSLAIENYFGCFFALPIVLSSMRWGIAAGRKTMVATATLLLVLAGPVKALTYLLMHGLVGLAMGSLWRLGANWGLSIFLCAFVEFATLLLEFFQHVRAFGAVGYVLVSSFLIRENILALITVNIHASLTYIITTVGINSVPSMDMIYAIFSTLLMLNCGFFVFLLHILYAVFFTRLGMKSSLKLPGWLEKAI